MSETMVRVVWPNGYKGACRKSMADRLVKKKAARYAKDVEAEEAEAEKMAAEADKKAKAEAAKAAAEAAKNQK